MSVPGVTVSAWISSGLCPTSTSRLSAVKARVTQLSLAAAWFALRGYNAAIPMEPTIYDLLVTMPEGIQRVQVKTTIHFSKAGWAVTVGRRPYSIGNSERRVPYDPELIDLFFIMDGDLNIYLISSRVIAGRVGILLRGYQQYLVGNAAGLMAPQFCAA
jgi:hypothetical protein